jgi:undecaprenyl phosphate N,N'-diacetylbacillosamine 1-phosphate transferase
VTRILDLLLSLIALIFLGWLILLAYLIACIDTRSNGMFTQQRIGKGLKPFRVYKIKSMKVIPGYDSTTTTNKDPRVTAFGEFIRKTKIDELPQVLNVLFGDMSLVGPRPTVIDDYNRMSSEQKRRADVRPGITGLAQINGNTSLNWPERIKYDLYYVENKSVPLYFSILLRTVVLLLTNKASSHPNSSDEWK